MKTWYTADPHFGHANILSYCDRPFSSIEEMDAALLAMFRRMVAPEDRLIILGDFMFRMDFERGKRLFDAIPGHKILVVGNHDRNPTRRLGWAEVHDTLMITDAGARLYLFHYPCITWPGIRHGVLHLFGHVHQNFEGTRGAVNVGLDVWNMQVVDIEGIRARSRRLPVNPLLAHLEPGLSMP